MILAEIFDKDSDETWVKKLEDVVAKHGLSIFSGNNAYVIASEDRNYVYRFWVKDPGYEAWLDLVMEHQDNPHVPKILGQVRTIKGRFAKLPKDLSVKCVKIEKLKPASREWGDVANLINHVIHEVNVDEWSPRTLMSEIAKSALELTGDENQADKLEEFLDTNLDFVKIVCDLANEGYNDFTDENIMMRGDVPVITDPFAS